MCFHDSTSSQCEIIPSLAMKSGETIRSSQNNQSSILILFSSFSFVFNFVSHVTIISTVCTHFKPHHNWMGKILMTLEAGFSCFFFHFFFFLLFHFVCYFWWWIFAVADDWRAGEPQLVRNSILFQPKFEIWNWMFSFLSFCPFSFRSVVWKSKKKLSYRNWFFN